MKYYAVTEDPNELMHYGIKGMKWGVIRTDAQLGHPKKPSKPRSPAYQRAAAKLSAGMRHGIQKAQANWAEYNSPANKAARQQKRDINKSVRAYKRNERLFEKHVQLARQGRLKYKGISDAEVERITDRLALERQARNLSGAEKPSLRRRINESVTNGIVEGVGRGTSSYINERMQGRGRTTATIKAQKRLDKNSLKVRNAARKDALARQEAEQELAKEYYKAAFENGDDTGYRSSKHRAQYLEQVNERKKKSENQSAYDKKYNEVRASNDARLDADRQGKKRDDLIKNRPILGSGTALQKLNDELNTREHYAKMLNDTYDYYDNMRNNQRALSAAHQQERISASKAQTDAARYRETMRQQQQAARDARQRELNEANQRAAAERARIDRQNTSKKRTKRNKRDVEGRR